MSGELEGLAAETKRSNDLVTQVIAKLGAAAPQPPAGIDPSQVAALTADLKGTNDTLEAALTPAAPPPPAAS